MMKQRYPTRLFAVLLALTLLIQVKGFTAPSRAVLRTLSPLNLSNDKENESFSVGLSESDQGVLGATGTVASLITLYSEYTLKQQDVVFLLVLLGCLD
jgi:hypothetical protein